MSTDRSLHRQKRLFHCFITRCPLCFLLCLLLFTSSCQDATARTIAFQRGDRIWISDIAGENQRFVCTGYDPAISPDGQYIAFTHYEESGDSVNITRSIALCTIPSQDVRILKTIPGGNSFGPVWSPDGDTIAFSSLVNDVWGVCLVGRDDSGYRHLTETLAVQLYSPTWTSRGGYVVCHGDGNIYTVDVTEGIIRKALYKDIVGDYGVTSGTAFTFSLDRRYLLFDADVANESMEGLHEPPGAVFVHDAQSGGTWRVTPRGICSFYPSWYADCTLIFSGFSEDDISPRAGFPGIATRIYTIDITGKHLTALIENATDPSVSAQ